MLNLIYLTNKLNIAFHLKKSEITIYKFNSLCLNVLRILQELNIIESFLVNSNFESCKKKLLILLNQTDIFIIV